MQRRPRVIFVGIEDPQDSGVFAGTSLAILNELRRQTDVVAVLGPLVRGVRAIVKTSRMIGRVEDGTSSAHSSTVLRAAARTLRSTIRSVEHDYILSYSSLPFTYLGNTRSSFWTDAVSTGLAALPEYGFHPGQARTEQLKNIERRALENTVLACYSSSWAANTAHEIAPSANVQVVPYGANLKPCLNQGDIRLQRSIGEFRLQRVIRILLVGGDWHRKGADRAIEIGKNLRDRGYEVELTIRSIPPHGIELPDWVRPSIFRPQGDPRSRVERQEEMLRAHLMLLPTRADCTPIVLAEAAAFGLPSVATDVGGVASILRDGVSGKLVAADASARDIADTIELILPQYSFFVNGALEHYTSTLNWEVGVRRWLDLLVHSA